MKKLPFILLVPVCLACAKDEPLPEVPTPSEASLTKVPNGFPEIPFPDENPFSMAKWELGKKLFYDPVMSRDYSISCGSCHKSKHAFADRLDVTPGVAGERGTRNAPSLANVAYHPYYTREGGVPTLEMQVLVPIQEHVEFDFHILELADRLKEDEEYLRLTREGFDREPDAYTITRALATFERTLVSGNSPYDRHTYLGQPSLSNSAERGMELFFSHRTNCSACHSGFNFTDYRFANNGIYENYKDPGRTRLTLDSADYALFKVPSLRNVAMTAPYMHDGSMNTLREVVLHYNSGGAKCQQKSDLIQPLHLSTQEVDDLVNFLESLTDTDFITNPLYHDN